MAQHKAVEGPNEAAHQGCHCHVVVAYDYAHFHLDGRPTPQGDAIQVRNERRPLGHTKRVQGFGRDQVGLGRRPHAHIAGA
jgi:hypothetical protein